MKALLARFLLPVLAGVCVVGTGFSVFYFSQSGEANLGKDGVSLLLAEYTSGSLDFELAENTRLLFHSSASTTYQDSTKPIISWQDDEEGIETGVDGHFIHVKVTYDPQGGADDSVHFSGKLEAKLALPNELYRYVKLDKSLTAGGYFWSAATPDTSQEGLTIVSISCSFANIQVEFSTEGTWVPIPFTFDYEQRDDGSSMEPKTKEEYVALSSVIEGISGLTLTITSSEDSY